MENEYIISETRLLELLKAEIELECLDRDGVDNWTWYMESRKAIIEEAMSAANVPFDEDTDFSDVARERLKEFSTTQETAQNLTNNWPQWKKDLAKNTIQKAYNNYDKEDYDI